jgi:hypothetical protein
MNKTTKANPVKIASDITGTELAALTDELGFSLRIKPAKTYPSDLPRG